MHLIQQKVTKGIDPPSSLTPDMIPPSERTAVSASGLVSPDFIFQQSFSFIFFLSCKNQMRHCQFLLKSFFLCYCLHLNGQLFSLALQLSNSRLFLCFCFSFELFSILTELFGASIFYETRTYLNNEYAQSEQLCFLSQGGAVVLL